MLLRRPRLSASARTPGPSVGAPAARTILGSLARSGYPSAMPGVITQFRWFTAACAAGLYAGLAIAGFGGVITGNVADATVFYGIPIYLGLGALLGLWTARATRRWLLPGWHKRRIGFAVVSALMMPFAVCVGQLPITDTTAAVVLLPGCLTGGIYLLLARRARRQVNDAQAEGRKNPLLVELLRLRLTGLRRERPVSRR